VPNDCTLGPLRRLLVITGPNMGGKSTYMRSIALIVLLACAGSFVPAAVARIGPIDRILTRIGAADDLARGRSTFMVEMTEAAAILHSATEQSLVLMDEIGRGTSTFDGMALAAAIARELVERNRCLTLFATHYFELTQLAEQHPEIANVHVAAAESSGKVVFLHEVRDGPANQSYGLAEPATPRLRRRGFADSAPATRNRELIWDQFLRNRAAQRATMPARKPSAVLLLCERCRARLPLRRLKSRQNRPYSLKNKSDTSYERVMEYVNFKCNYLLTIDV
jgi:hypothetical protein